MRIRTVLGSTLFFLSVLALMSFGNPGPVGISQKASDIFNRMTAEEKIGQLFMVTFSGKDISPTSDIYQLISAYHVGGVLLDRQNGNWHSGQGEAAAVMNLSNGLQQIEADAVGPQGDNAGGEYLPLVIGLRGGGDGYPDSQLITDLTNLPSEMTLGASWQPQLAKNTGVTLGRELSLIGINMYLGPSLDVLEQPNPGTTGDLGAQTFGGDPYWVGEMGRAYIQGIHEGSGQTIAVIATHFPGIGASDRSPEEEVATIRKAMEDLSLIDLAPFATVANAEPGLAGIADGFLVSHIRYQGLQGNIHTSTKPVSLDEQALNQVMGLPEFVAWRSGGGITVSDSLGAQSVRKFYNTSGMTFSYPGVAQSALKAGNDILQLSDFQDSDGGELQSVMDTIKYFQQQYQTDNDFAAKVDQAVLRILAMKSRIYPTFSLSSTQRSQDALSGLKQDKELSSESCKAGVTLISPNLQAPGATVIERPTSADKILVLTDSRAVVPCPSCTQEEDLSPGIMADTILRLYGPGASGLIAPSRIQSYTFKDLSNYLLGVSSPDLATALTNSTVILALLRSPTTSVPESSAFQTLLAQRPDLIRKKNIFVFALGAPYYLDSTEVSKVYAYYGLYSKNDSCLDVAARVLFGDLLTTGASPVSIEGIGYKLLTILSPNPDQLIGIAVGPVSSSILTPVVPTPGDKTPTISPTPLVGYSLGDPITFSAGPVLDHNQHLVPDGTLLQFIFTYPAENIPPLYLNAYTKNGMAQATYVLNRKGELQVSASSEPAKNSVIIKLTVGEKPAYITAIAPTQSEEPTRTTSPVSGSPTRVATPPGGEDGRTGWDTFFAILLILGIVCGTIFALTNLPVWSAFRWRAILGVVVGGLAGYDLIALGFPGMNGVTAWGGRWLCVVFGMLGRVIGAALAWWSTQRVRE